MRGAFASELVNKRNDSVIPAKAGIQYVRSGVVYEPWIPAFAGMTRFL